MDMTRLPSYGVIRVGATLQDALPFPFQGVSGGHIHVPAGQTPVNLHFYVADEDTDAANYNVAKNSSGVAIVSPAISGDAIELHTALFPALRIKVVADSTTGGNVIPYKITMKS